MPLTLHVKSYNNNIPENDLRITVNKTHCTIGRSSSNDLALPDAERIISHLHATINYENDDYYLTDNSTNGVFINNAEVPIGQGNKNILKNEDTLTIGKYICTISINVQDEALLSEPLLSDAQWQPPIHGNNIDKKPSLISDIQPESNVVHSSLTDNTPIQQSVHQAELQPVTQQESSVEQAYFKPPNAISDATPNTIDEDWDELTGLVQRPALNKPKIIPDPVANDITPISEPLLVNTTSNHLNVQDHTDPIKPKLIPDINVDKSKPVTTKAIKPKTINKPPSHNKTNKTTPQSKTIAHQPDSHDQSSSQQLMDAFLLGAGLPQLNITPDSRMDIMHSTGQMLREATLGFKKILLTRNSLKGEFRLGMTTFQLTENNPIKLSIDVDDALTKLLLPTAKGYLPPVESFQEASDDIQAHQMALLSGLRAALGSLIALFDPEAFENDLKNTSAIENLIPSVKKARYWEQFKTCYKDAAADAENDFLHFLGKEFTIAYEQQIKIIKTSRQNKH